MSQIIAYPTLCSGAPPVYTLIMRHTYSVEDALLSHMLLSLSFLFSALSSVLCCCNRFSPSPAGSQPELCCCNRFSPASAGSQPEFCALHRSQGRRGEAAGPCLGFAPFRRRCTQAKVRICTLVSQHQRNENPRHVGIAQIHQDDKL